MVSFTGMLSSIRRLTGHDASAWIFGWENSKGQLGTDVSSIHRFSLRNVGIAGLAILRLQPTTGSSSAIENQAPLSERYPSQLSVPSIGKRLTLHGSGFGLIAPSVLINNISQGVVANIIHPHRAARRVDEQANSLILTDAKFLPGMEGGAVSWGETGELAGLSMLPIRYETFPFFLTPQEHALVVWYLTILTSSLGGGMGSQSISALLSRLHVS